MQAYESKNKNEREKEPRIHFCENITNGNKQKKTLYIIKLKLNFRIQASTEDSNSLTAATCNAHCATGNISTNITTHTLTYAHIECMAKKSESARDYIQRFFVKLSSVHIVPSLIML